MKCYFCKKRNCKKMYTVKIFDRPQHICSECKYIHDTLYKQYKSKRWEVVRDILNVVKSKGRHCRTCKRFDKNNHKYCNAGYNTGVDSGDRRSYPFSFANHGCTFFDGGED